MAEYENLEAGGSCKPSPNGGIMKLLLVLALPTLLAAQAANERWTVILSAPPGPEMIARHQRVEEQIASRGVEVSSSTTRLLNAVFVRATREQASALRLMPGVARVIPQRKYKLKMARALDLVNAPAAWSLLGGESKSGAGVLIGVIDSGIDVNHPVLQDSTLVPPNGFPKCKAVDCAYTSSKVIVARS